MQFNDYRALGADFRPSGIWELRPRCGFDSPCYAAAARRSRRFALEWPARAVEAPPAAPSWASLRARATARAAAAGPGTVIAWRGNASSVVFWRDAAAWCPYCQAIETVLAERRIAHEVRLAPLRCYGGPKPGAFAAVAGADGTLPLLIVDGAVFASSRSAIRALCDERRFPAAAHPSLLGGAATYAAARAAAAGALAAERDLALAYGRWLLNDGRGGGARFSASLDGLERSLGDSAYFGGASPSFVDALVLPTLERAAAVAAYWKGDASVAGGRCAPFDEAPCAGLGAPAPRHGGLQGWAEAMAARGTWRRGDWYTHAHALPAQLGGEAFSPNARDGAVRRAIDQDWIPVAGGPAAHRTAAARLLADNADAVARFAGRGCRRRARRRADRRRAPLADPDLLDATELPEDARATIDALLRLVCAGLLDDPAADEADLGDVPARPAAAALAYLRDRVGVPRDCAHPVAHELRAHLNSLHGRLLEGAPGYGAA